MDRFFIWLESTALSLWIRESTSLFAFPGILSAHAVGMGLAAGINGAIALHLLGAAPAVPTRELKRFVPVMWFGFWLNALSGIALLIAYPTKALTNPVFYLKLTLIAIAMLLFVVIRGRIFVERREPREPLIRLLAIASLISWSGAIVAGRLLAYTYTRLLADF
jgi:hypothetical protein